MLCKAVFVKRSKAILVICCGSSLLAGNRIKQNKQQILVVAPSNTAVDLLSEKLAGEGLNVLRIINEPTAAAIAYGLDKKVC